MESDPLTNPTVTTFTYGTDNDYGQISNTLGQSTEFDYDDSGNLTALRGPDGVTAGYTYDTAGRRESFTDFNGFTTTYEYADGDQPTKVTFADGTFRVFEYNGLGLTTLDAWHEANGTLVEQSQFEYDASGRPTREIDGEGNVFVLVYDGHLLDYQAIAHPDSLNAGRRIP